MDLQFLKEFKPDGDVLLRRMSTLIDDATLELIADEDPIGGATRRARQINALRNICDGGPLLTSSDFASRDEYYDQDVRELLRFSCSGDPEDPEDMVEVWRGPRGHWARAFASAVLLRAYGDEKFRQSDSHGNYPVRVLAESILSLDAGLEPEAMATLAWLVRVIDDDQLWAGADSGWLVFTGLGILSLAVNSKNAISDDTITELANWLIAEEKRAANEQSRPGKFPHHWLFRATVFDLDREQWMAIGAKLAAFKGNSAYGDAVRTIGRKLSGQDPVP
jgi:hypothetical protein